MKPLVVLSDKTLLLETEADDVEACRDQIQRFAELEKSPKHVHTYEITKLSLWNAAAQGVTADDVLEIMETYARYPVPGNVASDVEEVIGRYGRLELTEDDGDLVLKADDPALAEEVANAKSVAEHLGERLDETTLKVKPARRGWVKSELVDLGWPPIDTAGYAPGEDLDVELVDETEAGEPFALRDYQQEAIGAFLGDHERAGSGVVVLPCGAGKTIVGLGSMAKLGTQTLIIATNVVAARQWIDEIVDKTSLTRDEVGEYTGETKDVKPVTVATYQILTWRPNDGDPDDFPHLELFDARDWGLIVYDEVHLLPAPVFRVTADIQAKHRLGLTATLVREDGRETDVFSLVGPKIYDAPWRELEDEGWIAEAVCHEVLVDLPRDRRWEYASKGHRKKARISMENPKKNEVVEVLANRHLRLDDRILVIGYYVDQLKQLADRLEAPLITGETPNEERGELFTAFREGDEPLLVVSKVANFAVDLPDANVAIQVSGTFGSRQEEAQRLGRILRPTDDRQAHFYTVVTRETRDQDFNEKRQLFLTEQGYRYKITPGEELLRQAEGGGVEGGTVQG